MSWPNEAEFQLFLTEHEAASEHFIRYNGHNGKASKNGEPVFKEVTYWTCSRNKTGGATKYQYQKRDSAKPQNRKRGSRKLSEDECCPCRLTTKSYYNTEVILGKYEDSHNHPLDESHIILLSLSRAAKRQAANLLMQGVQRQTVVSNPLLHSLSSMSIFFLPFSSNLYII